MQKHNFKCSIPAGMLCFLLAVLSGSPAVFSQGTGDMNLDGNLHDALIPSQDNKGFHTYNVPNQPGKFLYLEVIGADGGRRQYTSIGTCTKEGGQGAFTSAWFKIGDGGVQPGGKLRMIPGIKGTEARGAGIEGAGGGGGSGIAYLPPGSDANNPKQWKVLMAAGGGGGAASSGVCAGSSGMPGEAGTNGSPGNGWDAGHGGTDGGNGGGGNHGCGGAGWLAPGANGYVCHDSDYNTLYAGKEHEVNDKIYDVPFGGGHSGSGKFDGGDFWQGGAGGSDNDVTSSCQGGYNDGGFGFGGAGAGSGSGGGGGGYSGGGGGGLVGITGGGGGGGGGSYINTAYAEPFTMVLHQRGTTSNPADGSIRYQFAATPPIAFCDLGFHYNKSTEASILKTGEWTLRWQSDGNLVLYQTGVAKWASNTNTKGTDIYFQSDGNLVIRQSGNAVWASATANDQHGGKGGRKLVLTAEGHLFIVDQDDKVIWRGR